MSNFTFGDDPATRLELSGLNRVNVILGRNGSGKSRFLRDLDANMFGNADFLVSYVMPERVGSFRRDAGTETNMARDPNWAASVRRANQLAGGISFKAMSQLKLRNAETNFLRKLQDTDARGMSFQSSCLEPINKLLANISIEQGGADFVFRTVEGAEVAPDNLSSGESETIAVAAEVLGFLMDADPLKFNVLLLDEPDVHQHPDLQARFGQYILDQLQAMPDEIREKVFICIATHSTPLVCALAGSPLVALGTKEFDNNTVELSPLPTHLQKVGRFFGHPLSMSLSNDTLLILEGEDDERVWQQASRSSQGRIRVFPVLAQSVDQQTDLELFCSHMLVSIYDAPLAFSIRDGDGVGQPLDAVGCVLRFRLNCYSVENMLLTSECLAKLGVSWSEFQHLAGNWIAANSGHKYEQEIKLLVNSIDRLRNYRIKEIRNLIVSISGSKKPWEVIVGQALASLFGTSSSTSDPFGLVGFLGGGAARALLHAE